MTRDQWEERFGPDASTVEFVKVPYSDGDAWIFNEWVISPWASLWRLTRDGVYVGRFKRRDNAIRHVRDMYMGRSRRS